MLPAPVRAGNCGERVVLPVGSGRTLAYAYGRPAAEPRAAVLLLVGGDGVLALDEAGCPHRLVGNALVRSLPLFQSHGLATALVDARSDLTGVDGLAGHRAGAEHATDLLRVVDDLNRRTGLPVWVIGTSRGSISAAAVAGRAPDGAIAGVVLTSIVSVGTPGKRQGWLAQTVFDAPLDAIRVPALLVGHAADTCFRSPAANLDRVAARLPAGRRQVVTVSGGPGGSGVTGPEACEGRSPHGYVQQEAEVAAGIARFIGGGAY